MHDDDRPIGQVLSRREAVALLGVTGYALMAGQAPANAQTGILPQGACVVRPEQTEGPYFVDTQLNRSDLRTDPTDGRVSIGVPLEVSVVVSRLANQSCSPMPGVVVDLWQCDSDGVYSGVQDRNFNTIGKKFLRGYQVTDRNGVARFTTVYPGWYQGRAVHLHFKLRSAADQRPGFEFTSQLYFEESVTDHVFAKAPYAARGPRSTLNINDGIFRRGGSQLILPATMQDVGFAGTFQVALEGV